MHGQPPASICFISQKAIYVRALLFFLLLSLPQTGLLISEINWNPYVKEGQQKGIDKIEKIFTRKQIVKITYNYHILIY